MKHYGMLTGYESCGNCVKVLFEGGTLEITVLTKEIIRIFSAYTEEKIVSKAIEGDKSQEVAFTAEKKIRCKIKQRNRISSSRA